jgi:hypothetical protein
VTHSPADVVRWALVQAGLLADPAAGTVWPGYYPSAPDRPDDVAVLSDQAGYDGYRVQLTGEQEQYNGFQVWLRCADPVAGRSKMDAINDWMWTTVYDLTVVIGSSSYLIQSFTHIGDVLPIGREQTTDRYLYTLNAMLNVEQLT